MERDNISEFQYREPHPIFYVQQHHKAIEAALRAELDAERERRIAAERRAVLTAQERAELGKVGYLKDDLFSWQCFGIYMVVMFLVAVAIVLGWI